MKVVVLTVGRLANLLRDFFIDGHQWGLNISYSYEPEPLGTASALSLSKTWIRPSL